MFAPFMSSFVDYGFNGFCTAQPPASASNKDTGHTAEIPTVVPAAERLIAIGDLHGDLSKALRAFRIGGLIDEEGHWIGGKAVCVQVGDILDRGDDELQIFYFMERLQQEAEAAGGKLYVLNGNHETMNVASNHRYCTEGSNLELARWARWQAIGEYLKEKSCPAPGTRNQPKASLLSSWASWLGLSKSSTDSKTQQGSSLTTASSMIAAAAAQHFSRTALLMPGSIITRRFMADHPMVLQVGSSVFVHGGILPAHVEHGLEKINKDAQKWLLEGPISSKPLFLRGSNALVWARDYSAEDEAKCECDKLQKVLGMIPNAGRMVMGHTIQRKGINITCNGQSVRVDVGMSFGCGDKEPQVLEVLNDVTIRRLAEGKPAEVLTPAFRAAEHQQPKPTLPPGALTTSPSVPAVRGPLVGKAAA